MLAVRHTINFVVIENEGIFPFYVSFISSLLCLLFCFVFFITGSTCREVKTTTAPHLVLFSCLVLK